MRLDAGRAVEQNTASSLGALCPEPVAQILETPRVKAGFHPKVLCLGSRYISGVPVRKSRSCAHPDEQAIPISRIAFMNRALMRFSWRRLRQVVEELKGSRVRFLSASLICQEF